MNFFLMFQNVSLLPIIFSMQLKSFFVFICQACIFNAQDDEGQSFGEYMNFFYFANFAPNHIAKIRKSLGILHYLLLF